MLRAFISTPIGEPQNAPNKQAKKEEKKHLGIQLEDPNPVLEFGCYLDQAAVGDKVKLELARPEAHKHWGVVVR